MPRSRFWLHIGLPALIVAGCAGRQEQVYIDFDSLLPAETFSSPPMVATPVPPGPMPAFAGDLPALSAQDILLPATGERLDRARQLVKEGQDQAFEALKRQLRDIKVAEVLRRTDEKLLALEPMKDKLRLDALLRTSELFQRLADRRGIPLVQLTLLVGFPDPDPESTRASTSNRRIRRREQAKSWREIIRAIDAEFKAEAERIEGDDEALRDYFIARAEALQEQDEAIRTAEAEALREAKAQMSKAPPVATVLLNDRAGGRLRAVAGKHASAPKGPPLPPVPRFDPKPAENAATLRARLQSDAEIWLATKGYALARTKGLARDVTKEFVEWRKEQLAGR